MTWHRLPIGCGRGGRAYWIQTEWLTQHDTHGRYSSTILNVIKWRVRFEVFVAGTGSWSFTGKSFCVKGENSSFFFTSAHLEMLKSKSHISWTLKSYLSFFFPSCWGICKVNVNPISVLWIGWSIKQLIMIRRYIYIYISYTKKIYKNASASFSSWDQSHLRCFVFFQNMK